MPLYSKYRTRNEEVMHHTAQREGQIPAQPHNHRILNHLMTALLRSPFHHVVSKDLMLITFTGRKSGQRFTTPVTYSTEGEMIIFHSTQRWWKNLEGGAQVTLRLRGRERTGWATPTQDSATIARAIESYLTHKGLRAARMIDFTLADPTRMPTEAELTTAAHQRVVVYITLTE